MTTPLPNVEDRDTAPFFALARQGKLGYCRCPECQQVLHPPRSVCGVCGGSGQEWVVSSGYGRVYSHIVVEHPAHPAFEVPYTIVLVELEDAPEVRLVGSIPGRAELEIGSRMQVRFDQVAEDIWLPQWEVQGGA